MLEEVRSGTGDLWVTEGAKKVDAFASVGEPAVGGRGVEMFAEPGTKGTVPLRCWRYVRLRGRRVIIVFDADARTNANVQRGIGRLVVMLEKMGARVLVVNLPAVKGDHKAGVDDYLAAGGTVAELKLMAQPFKPVDVARERMSRDEELAAAVGACWRRLRQMPANGRAACSRRAAMRDLIQTGERIGKVTPKGLLVVRSSLDGAVGARIGERAWWDAIAGLEAAGGLKRAKWGPAKDRPGAYLLTPWGRGRAFRAHYWREATGGEGQEKRGGEQHARSFPLTYAPPDRCVHETRAPKAASDVGLAGEDVPALRWPKVVHTWGRREGRRVVVDSEYVARIGKQGEEVIRYLLERGRAAVAELLAEFGSKTARLRDFRRRRLKPLVDRGIIVVEGEDVRLAPSWREALERARVEGEELEDNRLQAERVARRKQERCEHFERVRRGEDPKVDPTPELAGRERVREMLESGRPEWERQDAQKHRRMVEPAVAFVRDTLTRLKHIRLGLLEAMWRERGGQSYHLRLALRELRCNVKRHAEHPGELFVYPPPEAPPSIEADVVALPRRSSRQNDDMKTAPLAPVAVLHEAPAEPADDWRDHPLDCECRRCAAPEASYATPWSAS
jgi:hypothetical protein